MKTIRHGIAMTALALAFAIPVCAAQGGYGGGRNIGMNGVASSGALSASLGVQACSPLPDPATVLPVAEIANLRFMREEEKMARDVYQALNSQWGLRVFSNIARSEQTHMDQVLAFMDALGLPDSATATAGVFNDASLQTLYDQLIARGSLSLSDALTVGALIEEVDIRDLRAVLVDVDDEELRQLYLNLMNGSYKHLRAFAGQIEASGADYEAQVLDPVDVLEILDGEGVAGLRGPGMATDASAQFVPSEACFTPQLLSDGEVFGSGATVQEDEVLAVSTLITVDPADVGLSAELVVVAEYWPDRAEAPLYLMRDGGNWVGWDRLPNSIRSAQTVTQLTSLQSFGVLAGPLSGLPGRYEILPGYRLQDGTLVLARDPVSFVVR